VEIALAQAIAIRHVLEAVEQDLLPRFVERHASADARCQPTLQAAELVRRVGMNACMQARKDLKILRYGGCGALHLLRERYPVHPVEHDTPATVDLLHAPNRRNGKPEALHGRMDCCFAECDPL
jgi:hypothetical protein